MDRRYTVFTYGTLMKDFYGHKKYMRDSFFICKGTIRGFMYNTHSGYPAVIHDKLNGYEISGELYNVSGEVMESIRAYEGVGSLFTCYEEQCVDVSTDKGVVSANVFLVSPAKKPLVKLFSRRVKCGDWKKYLLTPPSRVPETFASAILFLISIIFILEVFVNNL